MSVQHKQINLKKSCRLYSAVCAINRPKPG